MPTSSFKQLNLTFAGQIEVVSTAANLPTQGIVQGALRYTADTNAVYTFDGTHWAAIPTGSSAVYDELTANTLTVNNFTYLNSTVVEIGDNIVVLNSGVTSGTPTQNAGITVSRGNQPHASLIWDESAQEWQAGIDGSLVTIPNSGTVSGVSVVSANGVSGTVANSTTTPAITLALGDITPTNVDIAASGKLSIDSATSAFKAILSAQANMVADVELMMPAAQGAPNQPLINVDGLGQLGWGNASVAQSYVDNAVAILNGKQVADMVGTSNVGLSGIQTLDGASSSNGQIVLLIGQTDPTENGLWSVDDFGAWVRPKGWEAGILAVPGSVVSITSNSGCVNFSNTLWFGEGDGFSTAVYQQIPVANATNTGWGAITNVTPDKAYDASATTVAELADVLGTLIAQLTAQGVLRA